MYSTESLECVIRLQLPCMLQEITEAIEVRPFRGGRPASCPGEKVAFHSAKFCTASNLASGRFRSTQYSAKKQD